jgi:hypothetical protein
MKRRGFLFKRPYDQIGIEVLRKCPNNVASCIRFYRQMIALDIEHVSCQSVYSHPSSFFDFLLISHTFDIEGRSDLGTDILSN